MKQDITITANTMPGTKYPVLEFHKVDASNIRDVHRWISDEKAKPWLDLGSGRQTMSDRELLMLLTSARNYARVFKVPGGDEWLGLVCLNDAYNAMGSAEVWGVRGDPVNAPRNASVAAFLQILADGFHDLGRKVIGSWIVEGNSLSIIMHKRLGLVETGRQRARHEMNGRQLDRLLYDITAEEYFAKFPLVQPSSHMSETTCSMDAGKDISNAA